MREQMFVPDTVLPHADPMILLDEVARCGTSTSSTVRIAEDSLFYEQPVGVPSYVGIEYIAQTVAAHAGVVALAEGSPVRVGFLLGTRQYKCSVPYFPLGALLAVAVDVAYEAPGVSKFNGTISEARMGEIGGCSVTVYLRSGTEGP